MLIITKRTNVTVDDRRLVISIARGRKAADVAKVPHESFIRQQLKTKLGYAKADPAPQSIKYAAKQMAEALNKMATV